MSKITASDFIRRLEECETNPEITGKERKSLLEDMSDILDKAVTHNTEDIIIYRRYGPTLLRIETDTYRRGYDEGFLSYELWLLNGKSHREGDNPAYIEYHGNGNVYVEEWLLKDQKYRRAGGKPSHIKYDESGNIINQY